jgi:hypothetical protein
MAEIVLVTRGRLPAWLGAALITCVCVLMCAAPAGAFVYWDNGDDLAIGRSALDGTGATDNEYAGLGLAACSVAADGGYLYYGGSLLSSAIGRVPVAGGPADSTWIQGVTSACGLAIYGNYIYWTDDPPYYSAATGSIGRASLTGPRDVHQDFITDPTAAGGPLDQPCGLTVNADGIYWTNGAGGAIGHANLDGSGQTTLIPNAHAGCSITQDWPYLYWETTSSYDISPNGNTIARAFLNGAAPDLLWGTDLWRPCGLTSYSHYLYFGATGGVIDSIDINSPSLQASETQLAQGQAGQCGVAVDGLFEGRLKITTARALNGGRVALTVALSNPGRVSVKTAEGTPALLASASVTTGGAGHVVIRLEPTALARRELRSHRHILASLTVSYTPAGGIATPTTRTVTLTR